MISDALMRPRDEISVTRYIGGRDFCLSQLTILLVFAQRLVKASFDFQSPNGRFLRYCEYAHVGSVISFTEMDESKRKDAMQLYRALSLEGSHTVRPFSTTDVVQLGCDPLPSKELKSLS